MRLAVGLEPKVAVVDVGLPDGDGIELVRVLRARFPRMGLVLLTVHDEDDYVLGAMDAGASAFLTKDALTDEIVSTVRHAATAPGTFAAHDLAGVLRRRISRPATAGLTHREADVLDLLAQGWSVAEVAGRMYVSTSTAKTHVARVYEKLGARNRAQAMVAASRLGLIPEAAAATGRRTA